MLCFKMEAILLLAAVVGLLWGAVVFLRGGLLGGCLTVLLVGICFGVPFNQFHHIEVGPLTVDRLLVVLLAVQYVVWRRWGWADPKPLGKPEILLLIFLGYLTANTLLHNWQADECQPLSRLILYYAMPILMYGIARDIRLSERTITTMFGCFAVFGLYLALTALAEYWEMWPLVWPKYIVPKSLATAATSAGLATDPTMHFIGRGRGPLLNPIGNGILLAVGLGSLLMWWPRLKRVGRLAILAVSLLFLAAMYCGLTRSIWIGGILAVALIVGLSLPWSWRLPPLIGGLAVAVLLASTHWESVLSMKRDKGEDVGAAPIRSALRSTLATIAWKMFLDRPVFGCGYGQYGTEHENYVSDRSTSLALERGRGYSSHNLPLSLLVETGLIGLTFFATILFFWGRDAWRLWRDASLPLWARQTGLLFLAALGVYLVNGMFHDVSVVMMVNMAFFFLAGVTAGLRPLTAPAPYDFCPRRLKSSKMPFFHGKIARRNLNGNLFVQP